MKIDYGDVLTLDDDNKYAVAAKANYENKEYLYLVDINNPTNMKFTVINGNMLTELEPKLDYELITLLIPRFVDSTKEHVEIKFSEN